MNHTKKPAALKSLIEIQDTEDNYELKPFIDQTLTATSWYHGKEPIIVQNLFKEMITTINAGSIAFEDVIESTANKIELTYTDDN